MDFRIRLSCLFAVATLGLAATSANAGVVAFDMVGSSSSGLLSFVNPWNGAFASPGDGFQRYQRGVSASIPFSVLDDSLIGFPADSLGIIDENNLDEFFGVTDTQNNDNDGPVSATWIFDISGASNLSVSVDMGAMGDFEASDSFAFTYSIDGGGVMTLFESSVDEAGSKTYTLAGGTDFMLDDPASMNGVEMSNVLQTVSAAVAGSGNELTLIFTAITDGGSEAFAFQNIVVESSVVPVPGALWLFLSALAGLGLRRRKG